MASYKAERENNGMGKLGRETWMTCGAGMRLIEMMHIVRGCGMEGSFS